MPVYLPKKGRGVLERYADDECTLLKDLCGHVPDVHFGRMRRRWRRCCNHTRSDTADGAHGPNAAHNTHNPNCTG